MRYYASFSNHDRVLARLCAAAARDSRWQTSARSLYQQKCEQAQRFLCRQAHSAYKLSAVLLGDSLADDDTPARKKRKGECSQNCSIQLSHLSSTYDAVTQHSAKNLLQRKACYPHPQKSTAAYRNIAGTIHTWILKTITIKVHTCWCLGGV